MMKLSLQQQIYFFTLTSVLLFVAFLINILSADQVIGVALEREDYAMKVEHHSNTLKQLVLSENIYGSDYHTDNWIAVDERLANLLRRAPLLTPKQQTIQNSIKSKKDNVLRILNEINRKKLANSDDAFKNHLNLTLITQLEAIRTDSVQLSTSVQKDIRDVVQHQVMLVLSILVFVIFSLVYGAYRINTIFKTSLKEIKNAFEKNHSGCFQTIELTNKSEEFNSIVASFNIMNQKLSETTVSLETMKQIVNEKTQVLERLSNTDYLTNVANRRALFERINIEFSRVQRNQGQLAVVLLDCDFFKKINDEFGHLFGDEVLKHLCHICTNEIRNIDFFARYGGEEFIIILPDSGIEAALETAKRIQHALAYQPIAFEDKNIYVTVSMGICTVGKQHSHFEQVIKDADLAMYKAKNNGRNRIEVHLNGKVMNGDYYEK